MSTFKFDIFLSHNSRDKTRVRQLAERLQEHGLRVWFDEWVIKPGDDIYLAIERGLENSRALVLCISPAALGSGWVSLERGTALFRDPSNHERRFIPLLLADCDMPDTLRRYRYVDYRDETDATLQNLLNACVPEGSRPKGRGFGSKSRLGAEQEDHMAARNREERRSKFSKSTKTKGILAGSKSQRMEPHTYFAARDASSLGAKVAIARYVIKTFLEAGDSILLDSGSSLVPLAMEIAAKSQQDPGECHHTIVTHNYRAFEILVREATKEANLNVILAGGRYDTDLNGFFGSQTIAAYEMFSPRVVVMSISGLMANTGVFCHGNTEELMVKEAIFRKSARDRIILADYSKIGTRDTLLFGSSKDFRANVERCVLVTNAPPKDEAVTVRERFEREVEVLTEMFGVSVRVVG